MLPALPAQIHVPDVTSPRAERLVAGQDAAARALGLSLVVAAPVVVAIGLHGHATGPVIPTVWAIAGATALLAFVTTMAKARVDVSERSSRALLFAGLALLGPLTLHLAAQTHLWAPAEWLHFIGPYPARERTAAGWLHASLVLSGPSHLVFAVMCALRGARSGAPEPRPRLVAIGVWTTLATTWTCAAYGLFGLLPTAYVAVTCVPLLWLMRRLERHARSASPHARHAPAFGVCSSSS